MRFLYHPLPDLPPLSWCARVDRGSDVVAVTHGAGVETRPRVFVEGAWDGPFDAGGIAASTIVCGTGAVAADDDVRFVASTDQFGPLFSIRDERSVCVSNSPAFVLAVAKQQPDQAYPFYAYDLLRIYRQGLYVPDGRLKLRSRRVLHVHYTVIITVDARAAVRLESPQPGPRIEDYRSYVDRLQGGVHGVLGNAADPARKRGYRPLASLSRGYDSTATAVLAKAAGCRDTFTFRDSRSEDPGRDSGADTARRLGMRCVEYDRWRYLELERCRDVEFGYTPASSTVPIAAVEDDLAGRVLIVGELGDSTWDSRRARLADRMTRPWTRFLVGMSSIEFRLRVGYLMFAPASIAAQYNRVIARISLSEEMRPWSIGGDYDRPIPRRIGEDAGLPREQFGMRKVASSHSHLTDPSRFAAAALDDYRRFVREADADHPWRRRYWRSRVQLRHLVWDHVGSTQRRLARPSIVQRKLPYLLNAIPIPVPWEFMFTFQWTADRMRDRYAPAARAMASA